MKLFTVQLSRRKEIYQQPCISMITVDIFANSKDEATKILESECSFSGKECDYEIDSIEEN